MTFDLFCPFCESESAKVNHVVNGKGVTLGKGEGLLGGLFLIDILRASKIDEENSNVVEIKDSTRFCPRQVSSVFLSQC